VSVPSGDRLRTVQRWKIASLSWTTLVSLLLIVVPTVTEQIEAEGARPVERRVTLVQYEGWSVLWVLLPPILIPAVALLTARRWIVLSLGVLYLLLTTLAGASVGLLYMPAAIALVVAGAMSGRRGTDQKSAVGVQEP
jgi:hypothetical protein